MVCSLSMAIVYLIGQYAKIEGNIIVFWRGVLPLIFTTPFLFFIEIPVSPYFYMATIATSLIASYTDVLSMNGAIKFGAGVKLRIRPYALWIVFLVWFVVSASFRDQFLSNPQHAWGISVALLVVVLATSYMTRHPVTRAAFVYFLPIIIGGACLDLLNKTAMGYSSVLGGIFMYAWIQGAIITAICFSKQGFHKDKSIAHLFERRTLYIGGGIGLLFILLVLAKNTAMTYTENPAYVSAIILCSPVWTSIFYRLKGDKEETNEFAGLIVVASSIILVVLASSQ